MTEPVAYYKDYNDGTTLYFRGSSLTQTDKRDPLIKPLYTSEQLHPRVKMTNEQQDEFLVIKNNSVTFSDFWTQVFKQGMVRTSIAKLSERDLMLAWLDDGAIEIVPDMKWFVRSKKATTNGEYRWLENDQSDNMVLTYSLSVSSFNSRAFETKEEAEKWTNPLTESVQLPVEE